MDLKIRAEMGLEIVTLESSACSWYVKPWVWMWPPKQSSFASTASPAERTSSGVNRELPSILAAHSRISFRPILISLTDVT